MIFRESKTINFFEPITTFLIKNITKSIMHYCLVLISTPIIKCFYKKTFSQYAKRAANIFIYK